MGLFSHVDDLMTTAAANSDDNAKGESSSGSNSNVIDGPGKYELMSFVSHMGASTMCGHYVCHIKKENRWVIYHHNDLSMLLLFVLFSLFFLLFPFRCTLLP